MGCHEIVDPGSSWRSFFLGNTPPIPDWPNPSMAGAKGETYGASSEKLKNDKKYPDEKGISLDL